MMSRRVLTIPETNQRRPEPPSRHPYDRRRGSPTRRREPARGGLAERRIGGLFGRRVDRRPGAGRARLRGRRCPHRRIGRRLDLCRTATSSCGSGLRGEPRATGKPLRSQRCNNDGVTRSPSSAWPVSTTTDAVRAFIARHGLDGFPHAVRSRRLDLAGIRHHHPVGVHLRQRRRLHGAHVVRRARRSRTRASDRRSRRSLSPEAAWGHTPPDGRFSPRARPAPPPMIALAGPLHLLALVLVVSGIGKLIVPQPAADAMRDARLPIPCRGRPATAIALGAVEGPSACWPWPFPPGGRPPVPRCRLPRLRPVRPPAPSAGRHAGCGCFGSASTPPGTAHLVLTASPPPPRSPPPRRRSRHRRRLRRRTRSAIPYVTAPRHRRRLLLVAPALTAELQRIRRATSRGHSHHPHPAGAHDGRHPSPLHHQQPVVRGLADRAGRGLPRSAHQPPRLPDPIGPGRQRPHRRRTRPTCCGPAPPMPPCAPAWTAAATARRCAATATPSSAAPSTATTPARRTRCSPAGGRSTTPTSATAPPATTWTATSSRRPAAAARPGCAGAPTPRCQCRSCGNRKDGCTVFRYGNCNNDVACVGPDHVPGRHLHQAVGDRSRHAPRWPAPTTTPATTTGRASSRSPATPPTRSSPGSGRSSWTTSVGPATEDDAAPHADMLARGQSRQAISADFARSDEYIASFLDALYLSVFGRHVDAGGAQTWTNASPGRDAALGGGRPAVRQRRVLPAPRGASSASSSGSTRRSSAGRPTSPGSRTGSPRSTAGCPGARSPPSSTVRSSRAGTGSPASTTASSSAGRMPAVSRPGPPSSPTATTWASPASCPPATSTSTGPSSGSHPPPPRPRPPPRPPPRHRPRRPPRLHDCARLAPHRRGRRPGPVRDRPAPQPCRHPPGPPRRRHLLDPDGAEHRTGHGARTDARRLTPTVESSSPPTIRTVDGVPEPAGASGRRAHDLVGVTPTGATRTVAVTSTDQRHAARLPHHRMRHLRRILVGVRRRRAAATRHPSGGGHQGSGDREPGRRRRPGAPHLLTISSTEAWDDYSVPVAPYFALVDGRRGVVVGEGAANSWDRVPRCSSGPWPMPATRAARSDGVTCSSARPAPSGSTATCATPASCRAIPGSTTRPPPNPPTSPSTMPTPGPTPGAPARRERTPCS